MSNSQWHEDQSIGEAALRRIDKEQREMATRVAELRTWARSRIDHCIKQQVDGANFIQREFARFESEILENVLRVLAGEKVKP